MADSTEENESQQQEKGDYTARLEELELEKAKWEARLAKRTADVEALKAYKEALEALVAAAVEQDQAPAA